MTLDEFLETDDVAPDAISSVFGVSGVKSQFNSSLSTKDSQFRLLYFRPQVYHNRAGSVMYYSVQEILVDRSGKVLEILQKKSGY
jgi:hypothetical protein